MAFFDKIGDKAKGLVDSAKITYKVSEEKSKLSELYEHLGLLVWEAHQNDAEPPAELVPVFDRIREIHASIEKDNIFACQFHPEKSGEVGLQILKNFGELNR